jgi:hypothetical protein
MKESYSEDLANHTGLGSYADARKDIGGTLIGVRTGWVLSREIFMERDADAFRPDGRRNNPQRQGERRRGPARSETPDMYGNTRRGDWEIPWSSAKAADRVGKPEGAHR